MTNECKSQIVDTNIVAFMEHSGERFEIHKHRGTYTVLWRFDRTEEGSFCHSRDIGECRRILERLAVEWRFSRSECVCSMFHDGNRVALINEVSPRGPYTTYAMTELIKWVDQLRREPRQFEMIS